jgi:hypothetical protein
MLASQRRLSREVNRAQGSSRSRSSSHTYSGKYSRTGRSSGRRPNNKAPFPAVAVGLLAIVVLGSGVFALTRSKSKTEETETVIETQAINPNAIQKDLYLDYSAFKKDAELLNLKGMTEEEVEDFLRKSYQWNIVIKNANPNIQYFSMPEFPEHKENSSSEDGVDDQGTEEIVKVANTLSDVSIRPEKTEFAIPDMMSDSIHNFVGQIFTNYKENMATESSTEESSTEKEKKKKKKKEETTSETESQVIQADYVLQLPDFSDKVNDYVNQLAIVWKMAPQNGDITSYNKSTGEFEFGGTKDGYAVNVSDTAEKVMELIRAKNFSGEVETVGSKVPASTASIKDKYKIIASVTTKTTSNELRNTNVKLAAAAVNGTVLQPGEEFSFNTVVGQRTAEKGYKPAAAYNQGEVVEEVGGGVCQISSTLYNAVFRAGLTTTYRRAHTFAPTYVTPGTDATVSWPGPDYKFVNNSKHAIGILSWYSNQTATVQIYGLPVLPDGVKWELVSEKVKDLPVPAPQIITPEQGKESNGSEGSEWQAYKVITKDGKTEKVKDHYASYKGHTPKKYTPGTTESTSAGESTSASASVSESKSSETKTSETKATETKAKETKEENPEISNGPSGNNTVVTSSEDVISPGPGGE